jgi:hypothetical protein
MPTVGELLERIDRLETRIAAMKVAALRMKRMTAEERSEVARLGGQKRAQNFKKKRKAA